jgi:hypothetical protein
MSTQETNGLAEYGKKLEILGKKFQNPKTKLHDIFKDVFELGLIISFRVEPDNEQCVDEKVVF